MGVRELDSPSLVLYYLGLPGPIVSDTNSVESPMFIPGTKSWVGTGQTVTMMMCIGSHFPQFEVINGSSVR